MKHLFCIFFLSAVCFAIPLNLPAQTNAKYSVANAHAHNDYLHPVPFYTAFNAGFGSIEVDIYPVNSELLVAHSKSEIQKERTIENLYLDPLKAELENNSARQLNLLVDIKENYAEALALLVTRLNPLKKFLTTPQHTGRLTVLISGNRPLPADYVNYPDYIFFDSDLSIAHTEEQWKRVGLVSYNFSKLSKWKGQDKLPAEDEVLLKRRVDDVHASGKKIRFWAAPDNDLGWAKLMELGVDYIGTDKINELASSLAKSH